MDHNDSPQVCLKLKSGVQPYALVGLVAPAAAAHGVEVVHHRARRGLEGAEALPHLCSSVAARGGCAAIVLLLCGPTRRVFSTFFAF
jgi:hypothetical protein